MGNKQIPAASKETLLDKSDATDHWGKRRYNTSTADEVMNAVRNRCVIRKFNKCWQGFPFGEGLEISRCEKLYEQHRAECGKEMERAMWRVFKYSTFSFGFE